MRAAFSSKSGSRGNSQLRECQGRRASSASQRHTVVWPIDATRPRRMASRRISGTLSRERGRPCSWGSSQARALIATSTLGGKAGRTASPRALLEAGEALLEEALAPLADDLSGGVQPGGNLVVAEPFGGVEHDPGANDVPVR